MTRKSTKHVIYGLFDPTDPNQEIRYVGYTGFTVEQRIIDHVAGARKYNGTHKQKWVRKLLRGDREPAYKILEITTSRHWKARESYWIAELRRQGARLTNSTYGGEGLINPSKDVRKRISQKVSKALVGNQFRKGKRGTPEFGEHMSKVLRTSKKFKKAQAKWRGIARHIPTAEEREATSIRNTGRPRPDAVALAKTQAKKNKGSFWVNNGVENKLIRPGERAPRGFKHGRLMVGRPHSEEAKQKLSWSRMGQPGHKVSKKGKRSISEHRKNSRWIINDIEIKQIPIGADLPEGWRFGFKRKSA